VCPVLHSGVFGARNIDALFVIVGWDRYGLHIKRIGTCYTELVFLHPLQCTGLIVHSDASGARNVNALFFLLWWDRYRFHKKKRGRIHYATLVLLHLV
jgi:hypothetical protein